MTTRSHWRHLAAHAFVLIALAAMAPPVAAAPDATDAHVAPATWAIVIGVGRYAESATAPSPAATADAERVRDWLTTVGSVPPRQVLLLTDGGAAFLDPEQPAERVAPTRRNIRLALTAWLAARARPDDQAIVYFAGQGARDRDGRAYLVPLDAARADLAGTAVDASWVAGHLDRLGVRGRCIYDTGFAGRGAAWTATNAPKELPPSALQPTRGGLWLAADGQDLAVDAEGAPQGAFTAALMAALKSGDRGGDAVWRRLRKALPRTAPRPLTLGQPPVFNTANADAPRPQLVIQAAHQGRPLMATFDPTSQLLATTAMDGTLKLWSVPRHRVIATLDTGLVPWLTFSRDGRTLIAEGPRGVYAIDTAAARIRWHLKGDPAQFMKRARASGVRGAGPTLSPDEALVAVPKGRGAAVLYDAKTGAARLTLSRFGQGRVSFSPTGRWLAQSNTAATNVLVFDQRGRVAHTFRAATPITGVQFSPDGKTLVIKRLVSAKGGGDFPPMTIDLIDTLTWQRRVLPRRPNFRVDMAFAPDGRTLALSTEDDTGSHATLWDSRTARVIRTLDDGSGGFLQFATDGERVLTYLSDDTKVWSLATGAELTRFAGEAIAVSPDGHTALSSTTNNWGDDLLFRDLRDGASAPLESRALPIDDVRLDGRAQRLRVTQPRQITAWDLAAGKPVSNETLVRTSAPAAETRRLDIGPAGALVINGDGSVHRVAPNGADTLLAKATAPPRRGATALAVSPSSRRVAAIVGDEVHVFDLRTNTTVATTTVNDAFSIAFGIQDERVLIADSRGRLRAWDTRTATPSPPQATGVKHPGDLVPSPVGGLIALFPKGCASVSDDPDACDSAAAAASPRDFAVTLWNLRTGRVHATLEGHTAPLTALQLTPDGSTVISGSQDTTIRLWDAATGTAVGTLALLDGGRDWVVVTPDGLYDGSPSGQRYMEWRVGDTLFALDQFAADFYSPRLLARLLAGERPHASFDVNQLRPPPRVRIVAPAPGTTVRDGRVKVVVKIDPQGGGASPVWLYLNGHRVQTARAKAFGGAPDAYEIELVEGANHIRATAFNADRSVEARGDAITVVWDVPDAERPVLHVVAVGIDSYQAGIDLSFAAADASAVASSFKKGLHARIHRHLLTNEEATRDGILAVLARVAATARPRDTVLVYLAGHGSLVGEGFYFLPHDVRIESDAAVRDTALGQVALGEALTNIKATKQILVLDACHSGASAEVLGRMLASRDAIGVIRAQQRLARASGTFLIAASTASQYAKEIRELGHGVLTYAFLAGLGLHGKRPESSVNDDGQITVNALLTFLDAAVPKLTQRFHGGAQNPVQASTGQDFPLVVITADRAAGSLNRNP